MCPTLPYNTGTDLEDVWSLVSGCTPVSMGCDNCAARTAMLAAGTTFDVRINWDMLQHPRNIKAPTSLFLCPFGDLFHERVPFALAHAALKVIRETPQHTYHILTKRASRLVSFFEAQKIPSNVWLGVSAENSKWGKDRVEALLTLRTRATNLFVAAEPLLGDLRAIDLRGIDWVIAADEKGQNARPVSTAIVQDLEAQCLESNVNFLNTIGLQVVRWGSISSNYINRS